MHLNTKLISFPILPDFAGKVVLSAHVACQRARTPVGRKNLAESVPSFFVRDTNTTAQPNVLAPSQCVVTSEWAVQGTGSLYSRG